MGQDILHVRKAWLSGAAFGALGAARVAAQTPGGLDGADALSRMIVPLATQLTLGAAIGFCVGFLFKKAVKVVAVLVGLAFVLLQLLAYADVITINWWAVAAWWDQMRQPESLGGQWNAAYAVLFANVPALVGAVPGLVVGLKTG